MCCFHWLNKETPWPFDRAALRQAEQTEWNAGRKKGRVETPWISCLETDAGQNLAGKPQSCGKAQVDGNGLNWDVGIDQWEVGADGSGSV